MTRGRKNRNYKARKQRYIVSLGQLAWNRAVARIGSWLVPQAPQRTLAERVADLANVEARKARALAEREELIHKRWDGEGARRYLVRYVSGAGQRLSAVIRLTGDEPPEDGIRRAWPSLADRVVAVRALDDALSDYDAVRADLGVA